MLAALILYISSVSLHLENRPMLFFFLTYHFICPLEKTKEWRIKWCIQNKIHSSIFMYNSNAIWSELLLQILTWLSLPWKELWKAHTVRCYCNKLAASRERWTVCKYTCIHDVFLFYPLWYLKIVFLVLFFANSNFIMPVNIIILSIPSML